MTSSCDLKKISVTLTSFRETLASFSLDRDPLFFNMFVSPFCRRLCDEDDELSEVEPDAVPTEVRDWLALTFTRSMSNIKKRGEEKPRFRTVAHAIRAGIMVDRIYRRMSSSVGLHVPPQVLLLLKHLDDWSFNVFAVNEVSDNHAIKYVGYELLQKYDLITKYKINTQVLDTFLYGLEAGYSKFRNPYHNLVHGADVAQTVNFVLTQSNLAHWLTDLEIFATIIAALIHDFEHTGTTNNFHINTGSEFALLYNDRNVLENHHISAAFRILRDEETNITMHLSKEEFREFRNLVIDMVLATDMSFHFQQIKNMKHFLSMPENIEKSKALSLVLHCADISHPSKDWELHHKWTSLLLEEFFRQGDREQELGLPFSPLCDRKNTLVAESQIGFIDFIVDPSFQVMGDMLEKILMPLHQQASTASATNALLRGMGGGGAITDESITEEVFEPREEGGGGGGGGARDKGTGHPRGSAIVRYEFKRPWVECLQSNKQKWKEIAATDAEERQANKPHTQSPTTAGQNEGAKASSPSSPPSTSSSLSSQTHAGGTSQGVNHKKPPSPKGTSPLPPPPPPPRDPKGAHPSSSSSSSSSAPQSPSSTSAGKGTATNATTTSSNISIKRVVQGVSRQTSTTGLLELAPVTTRRKRTSDHASTGMTSQDMTSQVSVTSSELTTIFVRASAAEGNAINNLSYQRETGAALQLSSFSPRGQVGKRGSGSSSSENDKVFSDRGRRHESYS
ncbi:hypothetical protein ACOMHN_049505 [Nucella lapillus]